MAYTVKKAQADLIKGARIVSDKGLSWGSSGNMSMRVTPDVFVITASGSRYDMLTPRHVVPCAVNGTIIHARVKPSVEHDMHRGIYKRRPDVNCILHIHPFYSVVMVSGNKVSFNARCMAEADYYLGSIAQVPYYKAGSKQLASAVEKKVGRSSVVILKNHGIIALGKNFESALNGAEAFEFVARLQYCARLAKITLPRFT